MRPWRRNRGGARIHERLQAAYDLAISIVRSFRGTTTLVNVNDVRGHAAVLAVLDEAIAVVAEAPK